MRIPNHDIIIHDHDSIRKYNQERIVSVPCDALMFPKRFMALPKWLLHWGKCGDTYHLLSSNLCNFGTDFDDIR